MERGRADAAVAAAASSMPFTIEEWLDYLVDNNDRFRHLLQNASATRRSIGERISAMPGLAPAARIHPN
eukprot:9031740-Karenia_brevis.AAC.1